MQKLHFLCSDLNIFWYCIYALRKKFSGLYFPVFGMKTEIYGVNLRFQSEYKKTRIRKNFIFGHFSRSDGYMYQVNSEKTEQYNVLKIILAIWDSSLYEKNYNYDLFLCFLLVKTEFNQIFCKLLVWLQRMILFCCCCCCYCCWYCL